jgi:8-oxo-dGTP pyrophosphatase MutT (NUDIX family)
MTMPARPWPAIELARRQLRPRVPFFIDQACVGSVDAGHRDALLAWPGLLQVGRDDVRLTAAPPERDAALATINAGLREQGLIRAWRDETYPVIDPASGGLLARIERAASRFWGTLTFGAHANGWVAGADGQPAALWIAQRSFDKATDPGAHDNLVGGGVPLGQDPYQTLVREGWEEAGLPPAVMQRARPGRVIELRRDIPEGLQFERIHAYDLPLQPGQAPCNQDGEVHAFDCLPLAQALALAAGNTMTVDATLVTLDFALRHGLLPAADQAAVAARAASLWRGEAAVG